MLHIFAKLIFYCDDESAYATLWSVSDYNFTFTVL